MTCCSVCGLPIDPDTAHYPHEPECDWQHLIEGCDCLTMPVCPEHCWTCEQEQAS